VKFKSLHEKARLLDDLIDEYMKAEGTGFVPMHRLQDMVATAFPDAVMVNFGLHKLVFRLRHKSHDLALKVGKAQALELDHRAYRQLPPSLRHVYFAGVFWHTKYSLLQEYGIKAEVTQRQLLQIRAIAGKYGLLDITCDNIRNVNGRLKIIDAGISPPGLFGLWKTADTIARRLPPPLSRIIRKSRLIATVRQR
jgi:hypothetical protein